MLPGLGHNSHKAITKASPRDQAALLQLDKSLGDPTAKMGIRQENER